MSSVIVSIHFCFAIKETEAKNTLGALSRVTVLSWEWNLESHTPRDRTIYHSPSPYVTAFVNSLLRWTIKKKTEHISRHQKMSTELTKFLQCPNFCKNVIFPSRSQHWIEYLAKITWLLTVTVPQFKKIYHLVKSWSSPVPHYQR